MVPFLFFISAVGDHVPDILHPFVQSCTLARAVIKLLLNELFLIGRNVLFITELMLQACPEIHGNGPKLYLHIDKFLRLLEDDRHLDDKMKTPVSAGLWLLDVIFFLNQNDVILSQKAFCDLINILREGTDHPHPCDIPDIFFDRLQ